MDPIKRGKKSGLFRKRSLAKIAKIDKLLQAENQPVPSTSRETQDPEHIHPVAEQSIQDSSSLEDLSSIGDLPIAEEQEVLIVDDDEDSDISDYIITESDEEDENEPDLVVEDENNQALHLFSKRLRVWALSHKITHSALNDLLVLVRETTDIHLPIDSRTFLKTPIGVGNEISSVAGGQLWYQGIQNAIQYCFPNMTPAVDVISINLFTDGLPLYNSGPTQLWPILMQLHNVPEAPILVVGVFCGLSKPDNVEHYLRPLVTELNQILEEGIIINTKSFDVCFRAFIADSPARSFIKGVTSHNATCGCTKCEIVGRFDHVARTTVYEGVAADRTDAEFRQGKYIIGHQKRLTPLLDIRGIDIIKQVLVADELHLHHLGVMKKLLKGYTGSLKRFTALTASEQEEMNRVLVKIQLPSEIHRGVRSLQYVKFWKGTEFRSFLNHIGIPLLRGRIHDSDYEHFKLFYVAQTLLSNQYFEIYWEYAGQLLQKYVADFSSVYSRGLLTSNVHNLLHVHADVSMFGPLPTISSYPYENKLQFIKRLVRTGPRTLEQVVCRLTELREVEVAVSQELKVYPHLKIKSGEVILHIRKDFLLRQGNRNGWFLTKDKEIIRYYTATQDSENVYIEGHILQKKSLSFTRPCNSDIIFNFDGRLDDLSDEVAKINVDRVMCKLAAVSVDEGISYHFSPLLHTLVD